MPVSSELFICSRWLKEPRAISLAWHSLLPWALSLWPSLQLLLCPHNLFQSDPSHHLTTTSCSFPSLLFCSVSLSHCMDSLLLSHAQFLRSSDVSCLHGEASHHAPSVSDLCRFWKRQHQGGVDIGRPSAPEDRLWPWASQPYWAATSSVRKRTLRVSVFLLL